jgi:hypothetical protein
MEADHLNLSAAMKPMQHDLVGAGLTPAQGLTRNSSEDEKAGLDSEKSGFDDKVRRCLRSPITCSLPLAQAPAGHTLTITDVEKPYQQGDPFPEDPELPVETHQFTVRAVFVGWCATQAP